MINPFEVIERRLDSLENLILNLKEESKAETNKEPDLLTVKEVAKFLSLTESTIYAKVREGNLPYMKEGKRLYFSRQELIEYLKENRQTPIDEVINNVSSYLK